MKCIVRLLVGMILPGFMFSQAVFHITTIDSFEVTQTHSAFYGVGDFDAVSVGNVVYFAMLYQPDTGSAKLLYGRRGATGLEIESVDTVTPSSQSHVAIHMDGYQHPWIFLVFNDYNGGYLKCYHFDGNNWSVSTVYTGTVDGWAITTIKNDLGEIGVFFWNRYPNWVERLHYAYWNGNSWVLETVFNDSTGCDHDYSDASAVKSGDDLYVAFTHLATLDGTYADSTILHVCRKHNGVWTDDYYHFLYLTPDYNTWNEAGPALLGVSSSGELHLWQTGSGWGSNGGLSTYWIRDTGGWQSVTPDSSHYGVFIRSKNCLQFSSHNTAYYLSENNGFDPFIVWRTASGIYGVNTELPYNSSYPYEVWLYEPVITSDDTMHIFFWNGYGAPGYFVTFKEAAVYTGDIVRVSEEDPFVPRVAFSSYPSPVRGMATITFSLPVGDFVDINIVDLNGRVVKQITYGWFERGIHALHWRCVDRNGRPLPDGIYFYKFHTRKGIEFVKRFLILR